ncbi:MAG: DEAD/DEAH box helicase [Microbacteriaceae bacterium]|nr:MAG: DEAD/DEAH box helicase [Microbacteriaceae bacterium]
MPYQKHGPYDKQRAGAYGSKKPALRVGAKKSGPKAGSKSPNHRGYRPEPTEGAPKKQRWNADERAARQGNRDAARSERPNWEPRPAAGSGNTRSGDRRTSSSQHSYDDRRSLRDGRRATSSGQAAGSGTGRNRNDRPTDGDRNERPSTSSGTGRERNSARTDRKAYGDRGDQPTYAGRKPYGDRGERAASANRRDRKPYGERNDRRFSADHAERPVYRERPTTRSDVDYERPKRSFDDRPSRTERLTRDDRSGRTERRSDFYPSRPSVRDGRRATSSGQAASSGTGTHHFTAQDDVVLGRLEAEAITASEVVGVTFAGLGLGGNIVRELEALGAATPFPIQAATIPDVLAGKDVLGRGRTGSGKTIAFGAPLVERLMQQWAEQGKAGGKRQFGRAPRALILAPTRELALQIDRTIQPIARSVGLFTTQIYGGVPQGRQVGALQRGVDIVIGTPGRIEDLIEQRRLDLSQVTITVLDEADHMCDLGFLEPVQRILRQTADGGQKLMFSATLDKGVAALVNEFLPNPAVHEVAGEDQASSTIDHRVLVIEHRDKGAIIEQLTDRDGKTLVFARTRAFAEQLADQLDDAGIPAVSLHGDLNQSRRTRNLQMLTSGRVNVLVATDVAARGIHVDDIDLVIQADAPDDYKTYLHRSGRTGRAGRQGTVVTLIPRQRQRRMDELLERAEITADYAFAAPGDQLLRDLALAGSAQQN